MLHCPLDASDALPDCWVSVENQDGSHDTVVEVTNKTHHPCLRGQNKGFFLNIENSLKVNLITLVKQGSKLPVQP